MTMRDAPFQAAGMHALALDRVGVKACPRSLSNRLNSSRQILVTLRSTVDNTSILAK